MTTTTTTKRSRRVHAIDLFCGIGGLTHGLRLGGVEVKAGIDNDRTCRYAFEMNNSSAQFICKDVRDVPILRTGTVLRTSRGKGLSGLCTVPTVFPPTTVEESRRTRTVR